MLINMNNFKKVLFLCLGLVFECINFKVLIKLL